MSSSLPPSSRIHVTVARILVMMMVSGCMLVFSAGGGQGLACRYAALARATYLFVAGSLVLTQLAAYLRHAV